MLFSNLVCFPGTSLPKFELAAHAGCIAKDRFFKVSICLSIVLVGVSKI